MNLTATINQIKDFFRKMTRLTWFLKLVVTAVVGACVLTGCFDSRRIVIMQNAGPEELYQEGTQEMAESNFAAATTYFEVLEARFPFSNFSRQAQLDLIYGYFRANNMELAIDAANEFETENPAHPRVDYSIYMKGLVYFDKAPTYLERLFRIDLSDRPPSDTLQAFNTFQELLQRFPESPYAPDSRERMIFLRNRLAAYENYVADYYIERGAYIAAINRAKYAVENYPGAPAIEASLITLSRAYSMIGMPDLASDAQRVLAINFDIEPPPQPESQGEIIELEPPQSQNTGGSAN